MASGYEKSRDYGGPKPWLGGWPWIIGGIAATILLGWLMATARAAEFSGTADRIVDGDTFWICDAVACTKIRLCGINAPERSEPGYSEATAALASLVSGRNVRCIQVGGGTPCDGRSLPTNGDRVVAQCFADGGDVAGPLVSGGHACDWVRFSGGHYSTGDGAKQCH